MSEDILREEKDGVIIVTLNRPQKLNAVTRQMRDVLEQAVADLRDDPRLRMMLIRASGRYFTAGVDLKEPELVVSDDPATAASSLRRDYRLRFHNLFDEIEYVEKPVMIAIQGPCLGLGVELAGSCDFRVAAKSASFGLPEVNLGVIAGSGGISRFTRLCGVGWSKWLSMAVEQIDARTAQIAGFVQAIYPDEEFDEKVWELCLKIASRPPAAQHAAKLAIELSYDLDRHGARHVERLVNTPLIMTDNSDLVARQMNRKG